MIGAGSLADADPGGHQDMMEAKGDGDRRLKP